MLSAWKRLSRRGWRAFATQAAARRSQSKPNDRRTVLTAKSGAEPLVSTKALLALPTHRRIRDREHVKSVAKQPCLVCGRRPADAHHLRFAQSPALGRKVSDEFTVPLCRGHHREVHRCGDEAAWWKKTGIDPTVAARVLWLKTHPLPSAISAAGVKITKRTQFGSQLAMTSYRQIEANRRNALKSTGPKTEAGKQASRRNAVRHGLTAETVIGALEDAEDYKAFEAAITADYDAQSAVERELVLRLASILWRLRRATTMETGLFEIQAQHLRDYRQSRQLLPNSREVIQAAVPAGRFRQRRFSFAMPLGNIETLPDSGMKADATALEFARCFLRLANLPNFALDRLSRYEATLWRQAGRILFALDALDRRKPQERRRRFWRLGRHTPVECE